MKEFFMKILVGYLMIGSFFSFIIEFSWSWSLMVTLYAEHWFSFGGVVGLMVSIFMHMVIEPITTLFLWLPSMIGWGFSETSISFMNLIAPGFFEHLVTVG